MKSGLYIAELVKRLYNNESMRKQFPDDATRLKHILEKQVYGFAPSAIIYRIATNFIFGPIGDEVSRRNFVQEDTIPYAKDGKIQEIVDRYFKV
jgi:eco57I restriction endonuclease